MPDDRQTSFTGTCSGQGGLWDSITSFWSGAPQGCTGVIPDDNKGFGNVQTARHAAGGIKDAEAATKALDAMADSMVNAAPPDSAAAGMAADSLSQAFEAIAAARSAIGAGADYSDLMADAAGKTQTYLNQVRAGAVQVAFGKEQLTADFIEPIKNTALGLGIDLAWLAGAAALVAAGYIAYRMTNK